MTAERVNNFFQGDFTGYFYTKQELPFSYYDDLPKEIVNQLKIYKGELANIEPLTSFESEQFYTFSDLRVDSAKNIEFIPSKGAEAFTINPINNFRIAILKDFKILDTWALNGKTYGLIKGVLVGEVEYFLQRPTANEVSIVQPLGTVIPPLIDSPEPVRSFNNSGCLAWLSKWWGLLLTLLFFIFLFRECSSRNEIDRYESELESLREDLILAEENAELRCHASQIFFHKSTDSIIFESRASLEKVAQLLQRYPKRNVLISGHFNACSAPDAGDLVWTLDDRRAKKVYNELSSLGIDESRMKSQGLDFSVRIAPCDVNYTDQFGNQNNRNMRVEIEFL